MELKIVSINVNSIVEYRRKYMLNEFITMNPAHIYCVQETKFGAEHSYTFSSYSTFLASNRIGCGGTMLLMHAKLKVRHPRIVTGLVDCVMFDVLLSGEWITVGSIYIHPCSNDLSVLTGVAAANTHLLFGGDYNARDPAFGDVTGNRMGGLLTGAASTAELNVHSPLSPTCFRSAHGSFIDKFVTNSTFPFAVSSVKVLPSFSDHGGIGMSVHCPSLDLVVRNGFLLKQFGLTDFTVSLKWSLKHCISF